MRGTFPEFYPRKDCCLPRTSGVIHHCRGEESEFCCQIKPSFFFLPPFFGRGRVEMEWE